MIVVVGGIVLVREHDDARRDKPRDVVHVPMRIVADASLAEPDGLANAEVIAEDALVRVAVEAGVAHLHLGKEPLLGHEHRAGSIRFDSASLEDETFATIRPRRFPSRQRGDAFDRASNLCVAGVVRILCPRIEPPIHQLDGAALTVHESRRRVAQPDAVRGHDMKPHVARHAVRREMLLRRRTHGRIVTQNLDPLARREYARDVGVDPGNGSQLTRPVGFVVRPRNPGGLVRMPLGGH